MPSVIPGDNDLQYHHGYSPGTLLVLRRADLTIQYKKVVVGESVNFTCGLDWVKEIGVEIIDLNSKTCITMLENYIQSNPYIWNDDI